MTERLFEPDLVEHQAVADLAPLVIELRTLLRRQPGDVRRRPERVK